jgi:hypothetical protein
LIPTTDAPRRGRGPIIAGSVMVTVAIVGGMIGTVLLGSRLHLGDLQRDVVIQGAPERLVPGEMPFRVLEPLGEDARQQMTVGVALDDSSGSDSSASDPSRSDIACSIREDGGARVDWSSARTGDELWNGRSGYDVIGTARLAPGDYVAVCGAEQGELSDPGSGNFDANFTVGRVVSIDDFSDVLGPLLGVVVVGGTAILLFIVGIILLIVGLVQRSRAHRSPPGQYGYPGHGGPPGYGPAPGYGQQPGYGPPVGHGAPTAPAQPPPAPYPPFAQPPSGQPPSGQPPPVRAPLGQQPPGQQPPAQQPPAQQPEERPAPDDEERERPPEVDTGWTIPPSKH